MTLFMLSSMKNRTKSRNWGGARPNSGPKPGSGEMTKICVSVNAGNWQSALSRWGKEQSGKAKGSWLVDRLIQAYIENGVPSREVEAI
jgi:hypothetical protein